MINRLSSNYLELTPLYLGMTRVQSLLAHWAKLMDKEREEIASEILPIFGQNYHHQKLEVILGNWAKGDFSFIPTIEVLPAQVLGGAYGGFAAETNRIYLSDALVREGNLNAIVRVLLEEIGHKVDSVINTTDTPGDEGEYFALKVLEEPISASELLRIRREDDSALLTINGEQIKIEQYTNNSNVTNNGTLINNNPNDPYYNGGTLYNGYEGTGVIANGFNGGTGELYNGYNINGIGVLYNGSRGGIGQLYNGYISGTGHLYNGHNRSTGELYNGHNSGTGYLFNGHSSGTGYLFNGSDGGIGRLYNGYNGTGHLYNGFNSGTGYLYNGYNGLAGILYNGFNNSTGYLYNGINNTTNTPYNSTGYLYNGIQGKIVNASGSLIVNSIFGYILNDGTIENYGTFTNEGILAGSGDFKGNLTVTTGVIAPGGNSNNNYTDTNGTFTIEGNLTQNSSATLRLSLTSPSSYDVLKVTGNATFTGGSITLEGLPTFATSSFTRGSTNLILIDGDSDGDNNGTLFINPSILNSLNSQVNAYDNPVTDFSIVQQSKDLILRILYNNPPVANVGGPYTINEGGGLTLNASSSSDLDNDTLTYRWDVDGDGDYDENITGVNPNLSWTTLVNLGINDGPYTGTIRVEANDGIATSTAQTTLTVNNVPPVAHAGNDLTVDEGATFTLAGSASDVGTVDTLSYAWDLDNDGQYDDSTAQNPTHFFPDEGTYTIGLQVSDGDGGVGTDIVTLTVNNVAPTANNLAVTTDEDNSVTDKFSVTDPGSNDTHTFSITQQPTQGTVTNKNDGSFTFNPGSAFQSLGAGASSTVSFKYTATDNDGGVSSETLVTVTVTGVNDAPTLVGSIPDQNTLCNNPYNYPVASYFDDVDQGDTLTYTATLDDGSPLPTWLTLDSTTGIFTGTPAPADADTLKIKVTASDTGNLTAEDTFILKIENIINGSYRKDVLVGGVGDDTINGFPGNDSLDGKEGNDLLNGDRGKDSLMGGVGDDIMNGGTGNDIYFVDSSGDVVIETSSIQRFNRDTVQSSVSYSLPANVEYLILTGSDSLKGTGNNLNNIITGNSGNNNLDGSDGNDILIGGAGKDTLTGGTGNDKFNYKTLTDSLLDNYDVITDFNANSADKFVVTRRARRSQLLNVGIVTSLTEGDIRTKLTSSNFLANYVAVFTMGSGQTFMAINDGIAGFNSTKDGIVEITGYSGTLDLADFTTIG